MGEPNLSSDEQVLLRTQGVHVKSIPFEGILTNRRIILVDRAKNILPTKEIPLSTIQQVETGENAIGDSVLTVTVMSGAGQTRQMVLTFSRAQGGARQQGEWARMLQEILSPSYGQAQRSAAPSAQPRIDVVNSPAGMPRKAPVKRVVESGGYDQPAPAPAPAARQPEMSPSGETAFCTRCGNRVPAESVFCNRCGTPIVAPKSTQPPAPRRQPVPPPVAEPVYEQPVARTYQEPPRAPAPQVQPRPPTGYEGRPAAPAQKPAKKGILGGLFSFGGKKPAAPKPPAPPRERKARRSLMPGRNVIIGGIVIVVLIAVIAAGALFVYPMVTSGALGGLSLPGGNSSSSSSSGITLSTATADSIKVKETTAPTIPAEGVWVSIDYMGGYKGTYGMASDLQTVEDSGARLFEVVNATGLIKATLEKKDSSAKRELVVGIYKDGKLLKDGKTALAYGKVTISADVGNRIAATTTTATAGNSTANSTVTTKVTTKQTTAAAAKTTTTTKTTTKAT